MGQEILYCFKCQERVTSADLDASNALRFGNRTACRKCVPDLLASLSPQERKDLVSRVQGPKKAATARFTVPATPRPKAIALPGDGGSNQVMAWSIGGVAAALVVGIVLLVTGSGSSPAPRDPAPAPISRGPEESPRDRAAREAIARARSLPSSDVDAQLAAFEQAARTAEGTSREREARDLRDEFIAIRRKGYAKELASVEERARGVLQKEEFGAALAIFEAVRALHAGPEWNGLVDAKLQDVRKAVDALYAPLKDQAATARGKGEENDVKTLRERVARWGLPDKAADLEAHLKTVQPEPTPKPAGWQWVPIFDGKSVDFLSMNGEGAWNVENGTLVHVKGRKSSAQTKRRFADGDFRIRFKVSKASHVGFAFRQVSADAYYFVALNGAELNQLDEKEHEFFVTCRGPEVKATLDEKPFPVEAKGKPTEGPLQFNAYGEYFVIKALEFREPLESLHPIGHWTLDAVVGGTVADASGFGNPGTVVDGAAPVPGRINGALQFDGKRSHVTVPHAPALAVTGALTIAAWVNPAPAGDVPTPSVVEKWDGGPDGGVSGYFLRLGKGGLAHFSLGSPGKLAEVYSLKTVPPESWTFLAATYDTGILKMYVNGALERTATTTYVPGPSRGPLRIAMGGGGGAHYFAGGIDDVRVYNRALSADEIAKLAGK